MARILHSNDDNHFYFRRTSCILGYATLTKAVEASQVLNGLIYNNCTLEMEFCSVLDQMTAKKLQKSETYG